MSARAEASGRRPEYRPNATSFSSFPFSRPLRGDVSPFSPPGAAPRSIWLSTGGPVERFFSNILNGSPAGWGRLPTIAGDPGSTYRGTASFTGSGEQITVEHVILSIKTFLIIHAQRPGAPLGLGTRAAGAHQASTSLRLKRRALRENSTAWARCRASRNRKIVARYTRSKWRPVAGIATRAVRSAGGEVLLRVHRQALLRIRAAKLRSAYPRRRCGRYA